MNTRIPICCGMAAPFSITDEDIPGRKEKVICVDFSALMMMFHLFSHGSMFERACCRPCAARVRESAETRNAVSSAYVHAMLWLPVGMGMSAVYTEYRLG